MSNNQLDTKNIEKVLSNSECLIAESEVSLAYDKLAKDLNLHYKNISPIILVVLNGGLIPAGNLLTRLSFFHRMDYIHATRYQDNKGTDNLVWKAHTDIDITDEHVLLIDDIFDQGITLKNIIQELDTKKPKSIKSCCLLNKSHDRKVKDFNVDFIGMNVEDKYIYGCGMDYHGYLRHLPGIYALKNT